MYIQVLLTKFAANNKVHRDIRWGNIGKYEDTTTEKIIIVIYDLLNVVDVTDVGDDGGRGGDDHVSGHNYDWIERAIASLYMQ